MHFVFIYILHSFQTLFFHHHCKIYFSQGLEIKPELRVECIWKYIRQIQTRLHMNGIVALHLLWKYTSIFQHVLYYNLAWKSNSIYPLTFPTHESHGWITSSEGNTHLKGNCAGFFWVCFPKTAASVFMMFCLLLCHFIHDFFFVCCCSEGFYYLRTTH